MTMILGIDPGVTGACALIGPSTSSIYGLVDMPTVIANKSSNRQMVNAYALAETIRRWVHEAKGEIVAVTENVNAMPEQGVASVFAFGKAYGATIGVIAALGVSLEIVTPQRWKKHYGLSADKEQARELAVRLFPTAHLTLKRHHNRAEALLIARYYREVMLKPVMIGDTPADAVPF